MAARHCMLSRHGNQRPLLFLLLFSVSIFTHHSFCAQGRVILLEKQPQTEHKEDTTSQGRRVLIGSRPPRCESKCRNCGHCEAVQVPVVPNLKHQPTIRSRDLPRNVAYSREDYLSNYKPMCWKCKCGDLIFNP
ncbi:unnamed protein product [Cuscuta campestris]|uniref:Epidermal patterning factor-like protein n=2 Tax=Cuscuta sect. Cleistogrammica TaxID=1824901 RepID=A0A484LFP6_9ASTE|nr:hypothetical protein DM860_013175 [Cuscuta australis]VFQ75174.1 unnamed protein product [Cuscuta campestris]